MVFMIITMNGQIRQMVNIELAKRDIKQVDLASKLGMKRQYLSEMLNGNIAAIPKSWQKVFEELELEFLVVPKKRVDEIKEGLLD